MRPNTDSIVPLHRADHDLNAVTATLTTMQQTPLSPLPTDTHFERLQASAPVLHRVYLPLLDFIEENGQMGLAVVLAMHSESLPRNFRDILPFASSTCHVIAAISVGLCEFLLGFILASPFWLVGVVPVHHYASLAVQLGTLASYGLILAAIPFLQLLHRSSGSQAAIATALGWQSLCVRWFCVEDDRRSKLSLFFTFRPVRDVVFLVAFVAIGWTGVLGWKSFRSSGVWLQRFWLLIVFGQLFAIQEFYRNGGGVGRTIK